MVSYRLWLSMLHCKPAAMILPSLTLQWQHSSYRMLAYAEWRRLYHAGKLNAVHRQFFESKPAEALFDLPADPHEVKNLAAEPDYAIVLKSRRVSITHHQITHSDFGGQCPSYMTCLKREPRISQRGLWPQPNRESSEKEFQPRINTDAHGFVEIELLSVRIRVYPWFLIFFSSGENLRKKQNFQTLVARMGTDQHWTQESCLSH